MTSFAPNTRAPGVVQQVLLQKDGGLADVPNRIALVGYRSTAAGDTFDGVPTVIGSRAEGQALYGVGSQLDLMIAAAFRTGDLARQAIPVGGNPEIVAVALAPPDAPLVAATYTLTFAGTATAQGTITVEITDQVFSIATLDGATASEIAALVNGQVAVIESDLPLTSGVAAAVVTLTVRERGTWGNDVYVACDTRNAPGISCAVAAGAAGTGVVDVTAALDALKEQQFIGAYAVGQDDAVTRADVLADVKDAWTFGTDAPRLALFPIVGDASDAETEAAAIDDWRIMVTVGEKFVGTGQPWSDRSSRSMAAVLNAAVASRLFSRSKPNANYNSARIAGSARPFSISRQELDDAINGGVTMLLQGVEGAQIARAVISAVTDQTAGGSGPDKRWQPFEIAKVVQAIWWQTRALLNVFTRQDRTQRTAAEAKSAALGILRAAEREGWITNITNDSAIVTIVTAGATQLIVNYTYDVVTNIDVVAVTHKVRRT